MPNGRLHRIKRKEWKKRRRKLIRISAATKRGAQVEKSICQELVPIPNTLSFIAQCKSKNTCRHYDLFGICHYRHRCIKNHGFKSPETNTLLIINWFRHPALDGLDDSNLEYTQEDIQEEFKAFYDDVAPEIKPRSRRIVVAGNRAQYLRGNVYVEYESEDFCIERFRALHGRWYDGKRIHCELICTPPWNRMLCRLHRIKKCSKGPLCYFIHQIHYPLETRVQ